MRNVRVHRAQEVGLSVHLGRYAAMLSGLTVSATLVWVALNAIKWEELVVALSDVKLFYLPAVAGSVGVGLYLRSARWRLIAFCARNEHMKFFTATTFGVAGNMILPGRLGEVIRIVALARMLRSSIAHPLASAVIDRSIDVIFLTASVGIITLGIPRFQASAESQAIIAVFFCLLILTVLVLLRTQLAEKIACQLCRRLLSKLYSGSEGILSDILAFMRAFTAQRGFVGLFLGLLILGADYLALLGVLTSLDLELPWEASWVLWIVFAAGSSIPSAPGYIGVYQVAAIWALGFYGVTATVAVAAATVFQATAFATVILATMPQLILFRKLAGIVFRQNERQSK